MGGERDAAGMNPLAFLTAVQTARDALTGARATDPVRPDRPRMTRRAPRAV